MVVRVCRAHAGGKREPGSLALRRWLRAHALREADRFSALMARICPPPLPGSPALSLWPAVLRRALPRWLFILPPRCNRASGWVARSPSPRRRSPPRRRRRGATCRRPSRTRARCAREQASTPAAAAEAHAHHVSRPSTPPSLASRTRGSPREQAPSSLRSSRLGLPAVSRLAASRLPAQTKKRTDGRMMGVTTRCSV